MSTDLSEAQPPCERCSNLYGLLHERTNLFLCEACFGAEEDEHPADTRLETCATCLHPVVAYPCSSCGESGEAEPADRGVSSFARALLRQPVPLAVRLRDEAGPPLPQMVAQRRAQLDQYHVNPELTIPLKR